MPAGRREKVFQKSTIYLIGTVRQRLGVTSVVPQAILKPPPRCADQDAERKRPEKSPLFRRRPIKLLQSRLVHSFRTGSRGDAEVSRRTFCYVRAADGRAGTARSFTMFTPLSCGPASPPYCASRHQLLAKYGCRVSSCCVSLRRVSVPVRQCSTPNHLGPLQPRSGRTFDVISGAHAARAGYSAPGVMPRP